MSNLLSLVVPCFNEAECIQPFVAAIDGLHLQVALEFVFVDDGSKDGTLARIKKLRDNDSRVRYVSFSRNFGKESALMAGLHKATGDYAVTMDVDLQHSPSLLPKMLEAIESEGYDCAAACRTDREGEPVLRSWFAHLFYWLMNKFSDVRVVDGAMDYRMMSRKVLSAVMRLDERVRFTKGIYQWVGFKTKWLLCDNVERKVGVTKWTFGGLLKYSIVGILSFSTAPLQIASVMGLVVCVASMAYMVFVAGKWVFCGNPVSGWTTIVCAVMFMGGAQMLLIGILSSYIANLYREVKHRPVYIVQEES